MPLNIKAAWEALTKRQEPAGEKGLPNIFDGTRVVYYNGNPTFLDSKTQTLDNNSIIQACLGWISRNFPEPPSCIETLNTQGKIERDFAHPLIALLNRPEVGKMTSRRLWKATIASRFLDGNAYWEIISDRTGTPRELLYTPFRAVKPVAVKGTGGLSHYELTLRNGSKRDVRPEDMIHFADGIDEYDPDLLKGCSPLKSALRLVMTDNQATAYSERVLRNIDGIGLAVFPKGEGVIQDGDRKVLQARLRNEFGSEQQGSTFVASREIGIEHIGIEPDKMMTRELQRIPEERISAIFGVAAIVVGLGAGLDRSTFANMSEAREAATEQLLIPLWSETDDDLTIQLGSRFELETNQSVGRDLTHVAILQEDEAKLWERLNKAYQAGSIMRSEVREGMGFDIDEARDAVFFQDVTMALAEEDPKKALKAEIIALSRDRRRVYDAIPTDD